METDICIFYFEPDQEKVKTLHILSLRVNTLYTAYLSLSLRVNITRFSFPTISNETY